MAFGRQRRALLATLVSCSGLLAMTHLAGRGRAAALVESYARAIGASGRTLGLDDSVGFGGVGFTYAAASDELIGRAFVNKAQLQGASPNELYNLRSFVDALNDPQIGGMYERAGGYFVLDEPRDAYFLVRRFPVGTTSSAQLQSAVRDMEIVAATWTTRWFYEVAMIMHGHRPPPTARILLP